MKDQEVCKLLAEAGYRQHGLDAFEGPPYWHPSTIDLYYYLKKRMRADTQIDLKIMSNQVVLSCGDYTSISNSLWQALALLVVELDGKGD